MEYGVPGGARVTVIADLLAHPSAHIYLPTLKIRHDVSRTKEKTPPPVPTHVPGAAPHGLTAATGGKERLV